MQSSVFIQFDQTVYPMSFVEIFVEFVLVVFTFGLFFFKWLQSVNSWRTFNKQIYLRKSLHYERSLWTLLRNYEASIEKGFSNPYHYIVKNRAKSLIVSLITLSQGIVITSFLFQYFDPIVIY